MHKYLFLLLILVNATSNFGQTVILSYCDTATQWNGGSINKNILMEGDGSVCWTYPNSEITLQASYPIDITGNNYIEFWIYSTYKDKSGFALLIESENTATPEADSYYYTNNDAFEGWKHFAIDLNEFSINGSPLGWNAITNLYFTVAAFGITPDASQTFYVDAILASPEITTGPKVSIEAFFRELDYTIAKLSAVKQAVDNLNYTLAIGELAKYYRQRTSVPWIFDPHDYNSDSPQYDQSIADSAVNGYITVVGVPYQFPGGEINWFYNATEHNESSMTTEWLAQLNRMDFWKDMARAYWTSHDETYAIAFSQQLRSWISMCLRPEANAHQNHSTWREIDAGIRLSSSWIECFNRFLLSSNFSDEDLVYFLMSVWEQAEHVYTYNGSGNHLFHAMGGLYMAGGFFPEFVRAKDWRSKATAVVDSELNIQFLPDGSHYEFSPGYQTISMSYIMGIYQSASLFGYEAELPEGFIDHIEKSFEYLLQIVTPTGDLPKLQDSWSIDVVHFFSDYQQYFPEREDFKWLASMGAEGSSPTANSYMNDYSGLTIMRDNWTQQSNYIAFDAGLFGYAHEHFDALSLNIWSHGKELLYDGGGGPYDDSKWRLYAKSSFSHNTIVVDNKTQYASTWKEKTAFVPDKPLPIVWSSENDFDYAAAEYSGTYGEAEENIATHRREILYMKNKVVIVADHLLPNDDAEHTYQARWHIADTSFLYDTNLKTVTSATQGEPNIAIVSVPINSPEISVLSAVETDNYDGISGFKINRTIPSQAPSTTVTHTITKAGNARFLTVLFPLNSNESPELQSVSTLSDTSATLLFQNGERITITLLNKSNYGIEVLWQDNQESVLSNIVVDPLKTQKIPLSAGWNLIALQIDPAVANIQTVFPNAEIVKNFDGYYDKNIAPELHSFREVHQGNAYFVRNSKNETITIAGYKIHTKPIKLQSDLNLCPGPSDIVQTSSLPESIRLVKDCNQFYDPTDELGQLKDLLPGNGYFIESGEECLLGW